VIPRRAARGRVRSLGPGRSRVWWGAVLAEPRSTAPPRSTSRRRCFRPRAELATRPLTSPSTTLGGSGIAAASPSPRAAGPGSAAVSSKTTTFAVSGRLPSTSAPSPEHARRLRALRVGSRGARHRCRCSCARGFRHRDPASGAPSPAELGPHTRRGHECQRARPRICRSGTRRRSSTSATNSTREHDRRIDRSPPRVRKSRAHVRSRAPLTPLPASAPSREGRGPFATLPPRSPADRFRRSFTDQPRSCTEHGQRRLLSPPLARGRSPAPPVKAKAATSRGFTGQGPAACAAGFALARPALRQTARAAFRQPKRRALPQPDPLGHLSSWRPWHHRLERPAFARQCSRWSLPATIPPREPPPPRRVRAHGPPDDSLA
jgi:hypothetical protein